MRAITTIIATAALAASLMLTGSCVRPVECATEVAA